MKITLLINGQPVASAESDSAGVQARVSSVRAAAKAALAAHPGAPTTDGQIVDDGGNVLLSFRLPIIVADEIKQVFDRGTWTDATKPDQI